MSSANRVRDRDDRVNDEENYQAGVNDCARDAQRTGHNGLLIRVFGKRRRASVLDRRSAPCPRRNRAEKTDEEQAEKSKNQRAGAGDIACLQRRGGRRVGELRCADLGLGGNRGLLGCSGSWRWHCRGRRWHLRYLRGFRVSRSVHWDGGCEWSGVLRIRLRHASIIGNGLRYRQLRVLSDAASPEIPERGPVSRPPLYPLYGPDVTACRTRSPKLRCLPVPSGAVACSTGS